MAAASILLLSLWKQECFLKTRFYECHISYVNAHEYIWSYPVRVSCLYTPSETCIIEIQLQPINVIIQWRMRCSQNRCVSKKRWYTAWRTCACVWDVSVLHPCLFESLITGGNICCLDNVRRLQNQSHDAAVWINPQPSALSPSHPHTST